MKNLLKIVTLGQTIKLLRKKKRWKQSYLATRLNTTYETISAIERDQRIPRGNLIGGLARELDTTVEFLTREDPRFAKTSKLKLPKAPINDVNGILKSIPILILQGELSLEQIVRAALSATNEKE